MVLSDSAAVLQPDAGKKIAPARARLRRFAAFAHGGRKDDVLQRGEVGQKVVELKDKADVAVAKFGQRGVAGLAKIVVKHAVPARRRPHQRAKDGQKRELHVDPVTAKVIADRLDD